MGTLAEMWLQEGYEKGIHAGIEQGIEQGMQQGEYEKALAIARNMLNNNFDYQTIKKITGLTDEDLAKFVKNH